MGHADPGGAAPKGRRVWRRLGAFVLFVVVSGLAWVSLRLNDRPPMDTQPLRWLPPIAGPAAARLPVRARYLGVSTLLFDDGETAILFDGFFSRPPLREVLLGRIAPDLPRIRQGLQRAGITRLAAVVTVHSHYDHAMDTAEVARLTGAQVVGSSSTAQIARGAGLPESRIQVVSDGQAVKLGRFELRFVRSVHAPTAFTGGEISAPLVPPVRAWDYAEGGCFSIVLTHEGRSALVQGSAGFVPEALAGQRADVVFLGIGGAGPLPRAYHARYWDEVVRRVGARRVVPIHWDDFTLPSDQPFAAMPMLLDDVPRSLRLLGEHGARDDIDVRLPPAWEPFDPWAGLAMP